MFAQDASDLDVDPFKPTPMSQHKKLLKFVKSTSSQSIILIEDRRNSASACETTSSADVIFRPLYLPSFPQGICKPIIFKDIKRFTTLFVQLIMYRLILFCCGFFRIETSHRFFSRDANLPKMSSGFVVLCNHTHPLDFLYFSHILSPTFVKIFTKVKNSGDTELLLAPLDFKNTLKFFFSRDFNLPLRANEVEIAKEKPYKKLNPIKLAEHNFFEKEGPLVIFFEVAFTEGAVTNGAGVLDIDSHLANDIYDYQKKYYRSTIVVSISYDDNANASTTSPILSTLSLLMNPVNYMKVRFSTIIKIPPLKEDMSKTIYDLYNNSHMIPHVDLNSEDYRSYLKTQQLPNKGVKCQGVKHEKID